MVWIPTGMRNRRNRVGADLHSVHCPEIRERSALRVERGRPIQRYRFFPSAIAIDQDLIDTGIGNRNWRWARRLDSAPVSLLGGTSDGVGSMVGVSGWNRSSGRFRCWSGCVQWSGGRRRSRIFRTGWRGDLVLIRGTSTDPDHLAGDLVVPDRRPGRNRDQRRGTNRSKRS